MSDFAKITDNNPLNLHFKPTDSLNEVLQDAPLMAELHALGIKDMEIPYYLSLLLTVRDERAVCAACPGLEKCPFENPGMIRVLTLDPSGRLSSTLGYCKKAEEKALREKNFLCRDMPEEWQGLSYRKILAQQRFRPLLNALRMAERKGSSSPWVYLHGGSGSGKSYALSALANYLSEKGHEVAFLDTGKRFDALKGIAIKDKDRFQKNMDLLAKTDCLMLDGFGDEFKSDYVRDQILLPLLIARSRDRLMTFFSSCYSLDQVRDIYALSRAGEPMAERLASLIASNIAGETEIPTGMETLLRN